MSGIPRHVTALLSALKFRGSQPELLRDLADAEWHKLLFFGDRMHLTIPLSRACGNYLPGWVASRIEQNIADNQQRFQRAKATYAEIADCLEDANIQHVILKGFTKWPGYVEDPRLRMQSDIDLYSPAEEILLARAALSKISYRTPPGAYEPVWDHLPALRRASDWQWRGNAYDPEMPLSIELHKCFWDREAARFGPESLSDFWKRRIERQLEDLRYPGLCPADNLGYSALNVLRDLLRAGLIVSQVYELAWFLHYNSSDEQFWKDWREVHDDELRRLESISFLLASTWFSCDLPVAVQIEIERLPVTVRRWFDICSTSPMRTGIFPNKDGVWLHSALLKSPTEKRSLIRERLFPPAPPVNAAIPNPLAKSVPSGRAQSHSYLEGFVKLVSRSTYNLRVLPHTLTHGFRWWLATKDLSRQFWTFLASAFFFDVGLSVFFLLFNLYLLDRGFDARLIGRITSALTIGSLVGTIPSGLAAQRFGLRSTLLSSLIFSSVVSVLRVLFVGEAEQIGLAFLAGGFMSAWAVCLAPAISQLTSEANRPLGFSLVFSSGIAEGGLGGLCGGALPAWLARNQGPASPAHFKQVTLLLACGVIALGLWPMLYLKFASPPASDKKFYPRNSFLLRFLPAMAVWGLVTGAFSPFFNVYFSQHFRMPVERIGAVFSVSQFSQVLAILAAPVVYRKFGLVAGIVYMQLATALALAGLAVLPVASAAVVMYVGFMSFQWMSEPGMYSLLMNQVPPSERSGASALNFLVLSLANAAAAVASGETFARFGYPPVLAMVALLAVAAALLFKLLLGRNAVGRTAAVVGVDLYTKVTEK
jgi:MFS family permease